MNKLIPLSEMDAVRMTLFFACIQVVVVSLESLYHRDLYTPTHLLSWKYVKYSKKLFTANPNMERVFDKIFKYPAVLYIISLRLSMAILLIILLFNNIFPSAAILFFCLLGLMIGWRNAYSNNGSDQMINIVLIALSIFFVLGNSGFIRAITIAFIAFQGMLAYFTAGLYKAAIRKWLNGVYFKDIISTGIFGNRELKELMEKWSPSYKAASLVLITWELLMGFCIFFPPTICLCILAGGVVFHFLTALVMGLNTFFWGFLSVYPSIYFLSLKFH